MGMKYPLLFTFLLTLCVGRLSAQSQPQKVDHILYGFTLHTTEGIFPHQAIAIDNGRIVSSGPSSVIRSSYTAPSSTALKNKHLYPGWIDAHTHFLAYGLGANEVDLTGTKSWNECIELVLSFAKEHPGNTLVIGRGWDQNDWEDSSFPSREILDKNLPGRPIVLTRIDGHAAVVSLAALNQSSIGPNTSLLGGEIHFDSGLLVDQAMELLILPVPSRQEKITALLEAQQACFSLGLTDVHEAGLSTPDIFLIDSLHREGILKMPVYAMVSDRPSDRAYWADKSPLKTDLLSVRSFKFYSDGALGSRGALLRAPYHDRQDHYGLQLFPTDYFLLAAQELASKGWQMNTHAIGDSANRLLIGLFETVLPSYPDHRWRIEHAQIVSREDMLRMAHAGILPSVQPSHATSDLPWAMDRLGPERMPDAYAYRALLDVCGKLPMGTDFPVEPIQPLRTVAAGLHSGLTFPEILRGMTEDAAFSAFQEKETGGIAPQMWANFTIFDHSLEKSTTHSLLEQSIFSTWVHGEEVYRRP